jgi:hypothetical protein
MNWKTLSQMSLGIAVLFALTTWDIASAKPKGLGGGQCTCMCMAPSGIGGQLVSFQTYNSQGYSCVAFENRTCNVDNPYTGGVSTGSLIGCASAATSSSATVILTPLGGAQVVRRQRR